ncbi:MAG: hypothetical protein WBV82_20310, partial [Myxococcaceae bacterium]
ADIQTYAVGGVVSGLVGTGLTLKLNDGDPTSATSAPFTFPNRLTSGTAYTVSVVAQPVTPYQECTLTNSSGTVGTSDITDVQVTCPPPRPGTFTLGGMVANLEGSGLRLNVNGAEELSVAPDTTSFTFPTPLSDGAPYTITVSQQPAGATCTVIGGTGRVPSASVTTVLVECLPNAVVLRVGPRPQQDPVPDGGTPGPMGSAAIALMELSPASGEPARPTVSIPSTLSITWTSTFEGGLARSTDGRLVTLGAYRAPPGTLEVGSSAVGAARSVVTMDANGVVAVALEVPEQVAFTDRPFRSVVTADGTAFWMSGDGAVPPGGTLSSGGVWYAKTGAGATPVRVAASPNTVRWLGIYGGQLYMSAAPRSDVIPPPPPSPYVGVSKVGVGLPTAEESGTTRIAGTDNAPNPTEIASEAQGFAFVDTDATPGMDVLYIANYSVPSAPNSIHVQKYILNAATKQWDHVPSFVPKFEGTTVASTSVNGLAARRLDDGTTLVYTTSLNKLFMFRDNGTDTPVVSLVTTLPSAFRFRGVALAPVAPVAPVAP